MLSLICCTHVNSGVGAPASAISKAAEDDAAWTELQRGAAWWLGEFVNAATGEVTGKAAKEEDNGVLDDDDIARISPAEILALKVKGRPLVLDSCIGKPEGMVHSVLSKLT